MTDNQETPSLPVALLVLDVQEVFTRAIQWPSPYVRRTEFAIRAARLLGIPVLFTEQVPEKLGNTLPELLAAAGDAPAVFPKSAFSALGADGFEEALDKLECDHLLITGLEIPVCIYQTCLHVQASGRAVTVLGDCVAGRRPEDCQMVEKALAMTDTHWLPSESVFYSILGDISHPAFKPYTALVKEFSAQ